MASWEPAVYTSGIRPMTLLTTPLSPPVGLYHEYWWPNDGPSQGYPMTVSGTSNRNSTYIETVLASGDERMESTHPSSSSSAVLRGQIEEREEQEEDEEEEEMEMEMEEEEEDDDVEEEEEEEEEGEEGEEETDGEKRHSYIAGLTNFIRHSTAPLDGQVYDHYIGKFRKRLSTDDNEALAFEICERKWEQWCRMDPAARKKMWGYEDGDEDLSWSSFNGKRWGTRYNKFLESAFRISI